MGGDLAGGMFTPCYPFEEYGSQHRIKKLYNMNCIENCSFVHSCHERFLTIKRKLVLFVRLSIVVWEKWGTSLDEYCKLRGEWCA